MKKFFQLASIVVIISVSLLAILWALDVVTLGVTQGAFIDTLLVVVITAVASGLVMLVSRIR